MRQCRECVDRLAVEQDVELDELRGPERIDVVVKRGITLRDALELVVEVDYNFAQRQHEVKLHAVAADILLVDELAALVEAERHDGPDIGRCGNN